MKTQRGADPFGILLPSRWNQIGSCVSGSLATAEHRVAAAGHTGEGHDAGGGFGDLRDVELPNLTLRQGSLVHSEIIVDDIAAGCGF